MRWLVGSIADWDALYAEAYRALRPGGWLESYEAYGVVDSDDGSVPPTSAMGQWGRLFINFGNSIGRSATVVYDRVQPKAMVKAGFVDIKEVNFKVRRGYIHTPPFHPLRRCSPSRGIHTKAHILMIRHRSGPGPRTPCSRRSENASVSPCQPTSRVTSCIPPPRWVGVLRKCPCTRPMCAGTCVALISMGTITRRLCTGGSPFRH